MNDGESQSWLQLVQFLKNLLRSTQQGGLVIILVLIYIFIYLLNYFLFL